MIFHKIFLCIALKISYHTISKELKVDEKGYVLIRNLIQHFLKNRFLLTYIVCFSQKWSQNVLKPHNQRNKRVILPYWSHVFICHFQIEYTFPGNPVVASVKLELGHSPFPGILIWHTKLVTGILPWWCCFPSKTSKGAWIDELGHLRCRS